MSTYCICTYKEHMGFDMTRLTWAFFLTATVDCASYHEDETELQLFNGY